MEDHLCLSVLWMELSYSWCSQEQEGLYQGTPTPEAPPGFPRRKKGICSLALLSVVCSQKLKTEAKAQEAAITSASKPQMTTHSPWLKKPRRRFTPNPQTPKSLPLHCFLTAGALPFHPNKRRGNPRQIPRSHIWCMILFLPASLVWRANLIGNLSVPFPLSLLVLDQATGKTTTIMQNY